LAITQEKKKEIVTQYGEWMSRSEALILTDYIGLTTKELEELRRKVREVGGEFHIVKNTLTKIAIESEGLPLQDEFFEGTTAIGFAYEDPPALAKALREFMRSTDFLKIKGGYLGGNALSAAEVTSLAELPPLPVMQARLLSLILAPATQLARVLAEPSRQIAQLFKAYAEQDGDA
jgi:large subunit ribosomal protein L10